LYNLNRKAIKKLLIFSGFLFFLILNLSSFAQDYYYCQGRRIDLTKREDKIAVILNEHKYQKEYILSEFAPYISDGDKLIYDESFVVHLNLVRNNAKEKLEYYKTKLTGKNNLVKFVTCVYYGESERVTQIPTDEFIVKLRSISEKYLLDYINTRNNVRIIGNVVDNLTFLLKSGDGVEKNALELSDVYFKSGIFEFAEPNFLYPEYCLLNYTPNDTYYGSQWALNNTGQSVPTEGSTSGGDATSVNGITDADMDVNLAWDYTTGNSAVKVGVVDTGIDSTHPDFQAVNHLLPGFDAYWNKWGVPRDSGSHGTCTAGLIGGVLNNNLGIAGIAPSCRLMSVRIFNSSGSTTDNAIIRGFDTARVNGIDILSNSWGGGTETTAKTNAINNAANNGRNGLGCIILFASGNDGRNPPNYPSYLANVICVGASTTHDQKKTTGTGNQYWWGGNYGESPNGDIDVVAPTVCYSIDVQSTGGYNTASGTAGNYYSTFNGTSCSCPNAAGVAALVLSVNTSFTRLQVTEYLLRGAEKIDNFPYSTDKTYGKWNPYFGYGRVNAYNSVRLAAGYDVTPPSVNHNNVFSTSSTYPVSVTAEIVDQNGSSVPVSGNNRPVLFFSKKKGAGNWSVYDSVYASTNSGNNFTFYIPGSGWETQVRYYLRARDNSGNQTYFPKGAPDTLFVCYYAIGSFVQESIRIPSFTIPSYSMKVSSNVSAGSYIILNTVARIYLRHNYDGYFHLTLWGSNSNSNTNRVCLFSKNGGSGYNISGAWVSDTASKFWRESSPPYSNGSFKSEYVFRIFNGLNANGNWKATYYNDQTSGSGTCDSIRVYFTRTNGTSAPCARLDYISDSVVYFPEMIVDTADFYLKNTGTANLTVSSYYFTGQYASNFSVTNKPPSEIAPNDSGLFKIRLNPVTDNPFNKKINVSVNSDYYENAVLNIETNDPSKPVFKVSQQTDNPLPVKLESFTGTVLRKDVKLIWVTLFEINNSGFEIERQSGGRWEIAGFVKGAGNTNSRISYEFTDKNLESGKYLYRLKQIDFNGNFIYLELGKELEVGIPAKYDISQNYPNPFNPVTKIDYDLPFIGRVDLIIYDVSGRLIKNLVSEIKNAGYYTVEFNASNLASGVYFYRITVNDFTAVKRMVLIK